MPQRSDAGALDRQEAIAGVYEELATITRRASVRERTGDSPLTLVDHGLLEILRMHPDVSASDLARMLGLNRSTTSRQLAGLVRAGLLDRRDGRGGSYVLSLTAAGLHALEASRAAHLAALESRLGAWDADRIRALGTVLADFNHAG